MPNYKLSNAHWDGERLWPRGAIRAFPQGKQPKHAELWDAPETPDVVDIEDDYDEQSYETLMKLAGDRDLDLSAGKKREDLIARLREDDRTRGTLSAVARKEGAGGLGDSTTFVNQMKKGK